MSDAPSDLLTWSAIGGFTGLATFAFTIWDRLVRRRPIAFVVVKRVGGTNYLYLRVINPETADILVTDITCNPNAFTIADHETAEGAVRSAIGFAPLATISANASHDFSLFAGPGALEQDGWTAFTVKWRRIDSFDTPKIPRVLSLRFETMRHMMAAHDRGYERNV